MQKINAYIYICMSLIIFSDFGECIRLRTYYYPFVCVPIFDLFLLQKKAGYKHLVTVKWQVLNVKDSVSAYYIIKFVIPLHTMTRFHARSNLHAGTYNVCTKFTKILFVLLLILINSFFFSLQWMGKKIIAWLRKYKQCIYVEEYAKHMWIIGWVVLRKLLKVRSKKKKHLSLKMWVKENFFLWTIVCVGWVGIELHRFKNLSEIVFSHSLRERFSWNLVKMEVEWCYTVILLNFSIESRVVAVRCKILFNRDSDLD